jgi:integrase
MLSEGLGLKRIANLMAPLRGALERQVALKRLAVNPFDLVRPLKKSLCRNRGGETLLENLDSPLPGTSSIRTSAADGEPDPLTIVELEAILRRLSPAMANQVLFNSWTGLRTGELIALRTSDLQLERDRFLVRRSLSRGLLKSTKTDGQRWVNLLPPARAALESQLKLLGAPNGWIFANPYTRDRWANESKITRRWKQALKEAGVRYRRPYQMRHTYASWLLSSGENPLFVAEQMGHVDWSMLVKIYGRWIPSASGQPAGTKVEAAHANDWRVLVEVATNSR